MYAGSAGPASPEEWSGARPARSIRRPIERSSRRDPGGPALAGDDRHDSRAGHCAHRTLDVSVRPFGRHVLAGQAERAVHRIGELVIPSRFHRQVLRTEEQQERKQLKLNTRWSPKPGPCEAGGHLSRPDRTPARNAFDTSRPGLPRRQRSGS